MVLSFKEQFKEKILRGEKIHTIRKKGRWEPGRKIHAATGVRSKNYNCFFESVCVSTQDISIKYLKHSNIVRIFVDLEKFGEIFYSKRGEKIYYLDADFCISELSRNDGFGSIQAFLNWFNCDFEGEIIHWTNKRY